MSNGYYQLDMTDTIATDLFLGNLDTTAITDDALVTDTLVFAAMAFVILYGPKDSFTKQTSHFGLVGSVIDGFRFDDLSLAALKDGLRRG